MTTSPGGATVRIGGDATGAVVHGLVNGRPYTFTVRAGNAAGTGAASTPSAAALPLSPEVTYGYDPAGRLTAAFDSTGKPVGSFNADFLNIRGTMAGGKKGVGGWTCTRNKTFINGALESGASSAWSPTPTRHCTRAATSTSYGWQQIDDYWIVIRIRP